MIHGRNSHLMGSSPQLERAYRKVNVDIAADDLATQRKLHREYKKRGGELGIARWSLERKYSKRDWDGVEL